MTEAIHIVWFKRDLRTHDHYPLHRACQQGTVLPLYIVEPSLIQEPDFSALHWTFIRASLVELQKKLTQLGQPLIVKTGEVLDVLNWILTIRPVDHIWAHEEIGVWKTYHRDIQVRSWCWEHRIPITEIPQTGVVRGLKERGQSWAPHWERRMSKPQAPVPTALSPLPDFVSEPIPTHTDLDLIDTTTETQAGGEDQAHQLLASFLLERGANYHKEMSSPLTAVHSCSRLSPHLAWGTISMRQVVHAVRQRRSQLRNLSPEERKQLGGSWLRALSAYEGRLHWHGHFMQRLETEPRIEFESLVPQFDQVRANTFNQTYYNAWCEGRTGYPMVDACMRSLLATGWINFRMRAMLNSFAAYHLLLDWRQYHHFLARAWIDYEPGIHLSQCQMQSGSTGMNRLRIYNPTKQGYDHDPEGHFVRQWVPELANVPSEYIHEPEKMPLAVQEESGCKIGKTYPLPIVEHLVASKAARRAVNAVKYRSDTQEMITRMYEKHGSRKRPTKKKRKQT